MAWPADVVLVTVRHTVNRGPDVLSGVVSVRPAARIWVPGAGASLVAENITVRLVDGAFEFDVPAVDQDTITGSDVSFWVEERFPGGKRYRIAPTLEHAPGPVDVFDVLVELPVPGGTPGFLQRTVDELTGTIATETAPIARTAGRDAAIDVLAQQPEVTQEAATRAVSVAAEPAVAGTFTSPTSQATRAAAAAISLHLPRSYGAKADGTTDDTAAWQAAVNACPPGGVVDGQGHTYVVGTINLHSQMTVRNARLLTKAGSSDFVSPLTIGAYNDTDLRHTITIQNMHIDGRRALQTSIGQVEDGGRHGIRIIGRVQDIRIEDTTATHCASDGLCVFHGQGMSAFLKPDTGIAQRIHITRSHFAFNRRHGASFDSCDGVYATDSTFNHNGLDIDGGTVEGNRGDLLGGLLYGNGIDVEEYTPTTWAGNLHFTRCQFLGNAKAGFLAYQPTGNDAGAAGWVPRSGYHFIECRASRGVAPNATSAAIEITPIYENVNKGWYFDDVRIIDCTLDGSPWVRATKTFQHRGGTTAHTTLGIVERVERAAIDVPTRAARSYDVTNATVEYAPANGERLWLSPGHFIDVAGTRSPDSSALFIPSWPFADAATDRIGATFLMPADWRRVHIDLIWFHQVGAATGGDVVWRADIGMLTPGQTATDAPSGSQVTAAAGTVNQVMQTRLTPAARTVTGGPANVELVRLGAAAADTFVFPARMLGVQITRVA